MKKRYFKPEASFWPNCHQPAIPKLTVGFLDLNQGCGTGTGARSWSAGAWQCAWSRSSD